MVPEERLELDIFARKNNNRLYPAGPTRRRGRNGAFSAYAAFSGRGKEAARRSRAWLWCFGSRTGRHVRLPRCRKREHGTYTSQKPMPLRNKLHTPHMYADNWAPAATDQPCHAQTRRTTRARQGPLHSSSLDDKGRLLLFGGCFVSVHINAPRVQKSSLVVLCTE